MEKSAEIYSTVADGSSTGRRRRRKEGKEEKKKEKRKKKKRKKKSCNCEGCILYAASIMTTLILNY